MPEAPKLEAPWAEARRFEIPIPAGAAHVYTECAHIWNPVHTDRAVALAAGLPDLILHGSALVALAVTVVLALVVLHWPLRRAGKLPPSRALRYE